MLTTELQAQDFRQTHTVLDIKMFLFIYISVFPPCEKLG